MTYSNKILEHFENPKNIGSLDKNDPNVGTGLSGSPACGDVAKLQIMINENGIINDVRWKTFGCGSAIAASSLMSEKVKGKTLSEAEKITNIEIVEELSLPPVKVHCSILVEDVIKCAIQDWKSKQPLRDKIIKEI